MTKNFLRIAGSDDDHSPAVVPAFRESVHCFIDVELALDAARTEFYAPGYKPHLTELPEPSRVLDVGESEADAIFEFPDAGCC